MILLFGMDLEKCRELRNAVYPTRENNSCWDKFLVFNSEIKQKHKVSDDWLLDAKCGILFSEEEQGRGIATLHNHYPERVGGSVGIQENG